MANRSGLAHTILSMANGELYSIQLFSYCSGIDINVHDKLTFVYIVDTYWSIHNAVAIQDSTFCTDKIILNSVEVFQFWDKLSCTVLEIEGLEVNLFCE